MNPLTLDYCSYKIDEVVNHSHTIFLKEILRSHFGKKVELAYSFNVEGIEDITEEIFAAIEYNETMDIFINDHKIFSNGQWWVDISFNLFPIKQYLVNGTNLLKVKQKIEKDTEFESIYIVGNYLVQNEDNKKFTITARSIINYEKDLIFSGFPFYSGRLTLQNKFNIDDLPTRANLCFDNLNSVLVKVYLNGVDLATLAWEPFSVDISGLIKKGENDLQIELVSSCRNLLGPHHTTTSCYEIIGPFSFNDKKNWKDSYDFVKFGLPDNLRIELF